MDKVDQIHLEDLTTVPTEPFQENAELEKRLINAQFFWAIKSY